MDTTAQVQADGQRAGVADALVFRRVAPALWAHVGGFGRGTGWAGTVEVDPAGEPLLAHLPPGAGQVRRTRVGPRRVMGPYWAHEAALVRVGHDALVVLGHPQAPLATGDRELATLAARLSACVLEASAAKRLADELEVLHAVRAVATGCTLELPTALQHVVDVATASLSCELGVLCDGAGRIAVCGALAPESRDCVDRVLARLSARAGQGLCCLQDVTAEDDLGPLSYACGVRSLLAVSLPGVPGGLLVVAHTAAAPRGFTSLCQQLGRQVADAGAVVTQAASVRQRLRQALQDDERLARRDPLTGVGNRLAWDEALGQAQARVEAGLPVTVLTLDVDGLKAVNDAYGHAAGDDLLRRCAAALLNGVRQGDVVARLGGDEFAVLLPVDGAVAERRIAEFIALFETGAMSGVAASVGAHAVLHGETVADALLLADRAMYARKRGAAQASTRLPAPRSSGSLALPLGSG